MDSKEKQAVEDIRWRLIEITQKRKYEVGDLVCWKVPSTSDSSAHFHDKSNDLYFNVGEIIETLSDDYYAASYMCLEERILLRQSLYVMDLFVMPLDHHIKLLNNIFDQIRS